MLSDLSYLGPRAIIGIEIAMMEDSSLAIPYEVSERFGYGRRRLGHAMLAYCSGLPSHSILNRLVGLTSSQLNWKQHLREAIDEFGQRGLSGVIEANAGDLLLLDELSRLGLQSKCEGAFTLVRSCCPGPTHKAAIPIRELTAEDGKQFIDMVSSVFHMPADFVHHYALFIGRRGWTIFGALDGSSLVAMGGLYFDEDRALMCFGATLPDYRGQGLQKALISRKVDEAATRGVMFLSTLVYSPASGASDPSFRNVHQAGFTVAFERTFFSQSSL